MKCAQCLLDYVDSEDGTRDHFSWVNISEAEVVIDGMSVCLVHFVERMADR